MKQAVRGMLFGQKRDEKILLIIAIISLLSCYYDPHEKLIEDVRKGKTEKVEKTVKKFSINLNDERFSYKPLSVAVMRGNILMCEKLIELGADVNSVNTKGKTALHLAAGWGKAEMVEYLLKKGSNINAYDHLSWTPIMWASIRGKEENVKILLSYGANPNTRDIDMNTPLILAAYRNQKNVIKILLEYGADRNAINIYNQTFCDVLYKRGFTQTAEYFLCSKN